MSESARTPVEIIGVVYPPGAGGGRSGQETLWTLTFELQPWRRPDGTLEERQLLVRQPKLSEEELNACMDILYSYEIFRLRVYLGGEPDDEGNFSAELVELLGKDFGDAELVRRMVELETPLTVEAPFFGTLTLNRALNWWETELEWNGATVNLYLPRNRCDDEPELFRLARTLWDDPAGWDRRLRDFAVQELIDLKNDNWLGEDEKEVTPEEFRERMALESIAVSADGTFELTYGDGDLFWGHVIQVSGTLAEGPTDADIAG